MESAFAKPVDDVLANFKVDAKTGLSDAQVTELRNKYGRNCMSTSNEALPSTTTVLTIW